MTFNSIRQLRLANELTQEKMANLCGVHVNTYINWENNPAKIPVGKALVICKALGVAINDVSFMS